MPTSFLSPKTIYAQTTPARGCGCEEAHCVGVDAAQHVRARVRAVSLDHLAGAGDPLTTERFDEAAALVRDGLQRDDVHAVDRLERLDIGHGAAVYKSGRAGAARGVNASLESRGGRRRRAAHRSGTARPISRGARRSRPPTGRGIRAATGGSPRGRGPTLRSALP